MQVKQSCASLAAVFCLWGKGFPMAQLSCVLARGGGRVILAWHSQPSRRWLLPLDPQHRS